MESNIEKSCCKRLNKLGYKTVKLYGDKGIPDRLVLGLFKRVFFIEFKYLGGKLSKHQKKYILDLKALGHETLIFIIGDLPKKQIKWTADNKIKVVHEWQELKDHINGKI